MLRSMEDSKIYSNAVEDAFEEDIVFGEGFEDLEIGGNINEDCKSRICDWLCNT